MDEAPQLETLLTVESLLRVLQDHTTYTVAGYNGSCERVVSYDGLIAALEKLAALDAQTGGEKV